MWVRQPAPIEVAQSIVPDSGLDVIDREGVICLPSEQSPRKMAAAIGSRSFSACLLPQLYGDGLGRGRQFPTVSGAASSQASDAADLVGPIAYSTRTEPPSSNIVQSNRPTGIGLGFAPFFLSGQALQQCGQHGFSVLVVDDQGRGVVAQPRQLREFDAGIA